MNKKGNVFLLSDLERVIKPNIALLRQCGLSDGDIAWLCSHTARMLTFNLEHVKDVVRCVEELRVHRNSGMFKHVILGFAGINKEKVAPRLEFLKSTFGCSESEIAIVVSKVPRILGYSEENLTRKFQFLVKEVGMEPQHIVEWPALLGYSLEKRLVPRHCVMKILQAKGLISNLSFSSFVSLGEKKFILKFINCHEDSVPDLAGYYATACAGDVPHEVELTS
jgi:mTERF domain-containing protein